MKCTKIDVSQLKIGLEVQAVGSRVCGRAVTTGQSKALVTNRNCEWGISALSTVGAVHCLPRWLGSMLLMKVDIVFNQVVMVVAVHVPELVPVVPVHLGSLAISLKREV
jgi:hypothetical protein